MLRHENKELYIVQLSRILKLRGPEVVITRINKISQWYFMFTGQFSCFLYLNQEFLGCAAKHGGWGNGGLGISA